MNKMVSRIHIRNGMKTQNKVTFPFPSIFVHDLM